MILSSGTFLLFLLACLTLHYFLPVSFRNLFLLLASVGFFVYAMPSEALIMLGFCLFIYLLCPFMASAEGGTRRVLLTIGILLGVAFLVFYKYLGFLVSLAGVPTTAAVFSLAAPMGISYVTFQCISYLVEVYKGRMAPEDNAVDFFVYALFFAKLTAGPIEPPAEFLAQLKQERHFDADAAGEGVLRIAMGFVKKVAVADFLAPGVAVVFSANGSDGGWSVMLASVMYAIQLLFDFSGYTDIARGSAALFGVRLTENFDSPYMAVSVRDFWRRWHISLSNWLKTYIYIPLGGSRVGPVRRYLNIMITFLVSGIWHGASLTYVFWGLLHGAFQVFEILLDPVDKKIRQTLNLSDDSLLPRYLNRVKTFILVTIAWVFFRAGSIETAFGMLGRLFGPWGSLPDALELCGLDATALLLIVSAMLTAHLISKMLSRRLQNGAESLPVLTVCGVVIWAVFLVYMVSAASGGESSFIYFDF